MQSEPVRPMPIRPLPMQSMTNPPHANAPRQNITLLPKHGGIVAAVGRIFVKNMRVTRQNR